MASKKMDALTELTSVEDDDLLLVYDVDEAGSEKTKNATVATVKGEMQSVYKGPTLVHTCSNSADTPINNPTIDAKCVYGLVCNVAKSVFEFTASGPWGLDFGEISMPTTVNVVFADWSGTGIPATMGNTNYDITPSSSGNVTNKTVTGFDFEITDSGLNPFLIEIDDGPGCEVAESEAEPLQTTVKASDLMISVRGPSSNIEYAMSKTAIDSGYTAYSSDPEVTFDCTEIGTKFIWIKVKDVDSGNEVTLSTYAIVQDNDNLCP